MLRNTLMGKINEKAEEIIGYIASYGTTKIDSTLVFTGVEYEGGFYFYRTEKDQYDNNLHAFITLWTSNLIDGEEWYDYFESNMEFAKPIFDNFFKKDYEKYTFNSVDINAAKDYILGKVDAGRRNLINTRKRYPIGNFEYKLPNGMQGIYLNRDIVKDDILEISLPNYIISADELRYDNNWAGYKEIFIEADNEYIYFVE